ncbi:HAD domain-containing protein [Variovorax sp. HJSM1_2]|uniref:HAD domain-containing protein n=1 Tax=Variovorax sp. HJSM1_2 TaxID=3366263 RepID=UPI003BDE2B31
MDTALAPTPRKLVFLDFDDVLCLNAPYGGYDVVAPDPPPDLYERLFAPSCADLLRQINTAHAPQYIITTSWLRFLEKAGMTTLLHKTGLGFVAQGFHPQWEVTQNARETRATAIERWLSAYSTGERFVILDDTISGTGLLKSPRLKRHVVFCEVNRGLTSAHLDTVKGILDRKGTHGGPSH